MRTRFILWTPKLCFIESDNDAWHEERWLYSSLTLPGFYLVISVIYLRATCHYKKKKKLSFNPSSLHSRSLLEILPLVRKCLFMESGILVNIWLQLLVCRKLLFYNFCCQAHVFCRRLKYLLNLVLSLNPGTELNQNEIILF